MSNSVTETRDSDGLQAVHMYPNNRLKDQVRDLKDTFSGFGLLRATFKPQ
jgi:hypothetical protein